MTASAIATKAKCQAPGCDNLTARGICDACDRWVDDQVAALTSQCPYCPAEPRNLAAHCRAKHPNKPEARR